MTSSDEKRVSLLIPIRNEESSLSLCIESIRRQDYPTTHLEAIFIDGLSTDNSKAIVNQCAVNSRIPFHVYDNEMKTAPHGLNIGLSKASGDYIIRLDAHSEYPADYVSQCVATLQNSDADNVGGLVITRGRTAVGRAFAKVLSSKFGVGNSGFRTGASSGYVDTVPFGAFRRSTFEKYGHYDVRLTRNQDYELNSRIRKGGGRVYLNSRISLIYFCQGTLTGLLRQAWQNGKWNTITSRYCPGTMSLRHFVPMIFALSLVALAAVSPISGVARSLLLFEGVLYAALTIGVSVRVASSIGQFFLLTLIFPAFHFWYGIGSLAGLLTPDKSNELRPTSD